MAQRSSFVLKAQKELICPLCLHTLTSPTSLKCLHTYCEGCLERLHKSALHPNTLTCPECRIPTTLPSNGIKGLPLNFKLNSLVQLLEVEERRDMMIEETQKNMAAIPTLYSCPAHAKKPLDFYCEDCSVLICGHCIVDDHHSHNVKHAQESLLKHVEELGEMFPEVDETIESGENMLQSLKSERETIEDSLSSESMNVNRYFEMLHRILREREKSILSDISSQAKPKVRRLTKHIDALSRAIGNIEQAKSKLKDAVDGSSKDINLLTKENKLQACVRVSMKLVYEETDDCKWLVAGGTSHIHPFKPDPSVEEKCRSIVHASDLRVRKRSQTLALSSSGDLEIFKGRSRANAVALSKKKAAKKHAQQLLRAISEVPHLPNVIFSPVGAIETKSLIGDCSSHVNAFPCGVCSTAKPEGALLVTDAKHHLIRIVTPDDKCLEIVNTEGKKDGQIFKPVALTVDSFGNVLVADGKNPGRIQKFTSAGKFLLKFKMRTLLSGNSPHLMEPNGLVIVRKSKILVTDGMKACIHEFDESGRHKGLFGDSTDLKCPAGIAASENRVVVADKGANCVYVFTVYGDQLQRIGKEGTIPGSFIYPYGVALDKDGNIVVSECGNHRISIFTAGGKFVRCFGCEGSNPGMFRFPRHLCFNHLGQLVVADEENQRLQLFNLNNFLSEQ